MNTRPVVRWLAAAALSACATAGGADASGLNLGWGAYCPTNSNSMFNVSDPCDGSAGNVHTLVGSFRLPVSLPAVQVEWFRVDFCELATPLSDYWHLENENQPGESNPAGCRGTNSASGNIGSLVVGVSDSAFPATFTACSRLWGDAAVGTVDWLTYGSPGIFDPSEARLVGSYSTPGTHAITAGVQYGCFIATIDINHQVLDPNNPPSYICGGCLNGVRIVFRDLILRQPAGTPGGDYEVTSEDTRYFVEWQGPIYSTLCLPDPVRRPTWGQLKSLYR